MIEASKQKGDPNPNGMYYMDRPTWNSIWQDLTKFRDKLDQVSRKEDFSVFKEAHFLIRKHDGDIITNPNDAETYFKERKNLKILITDISFKPIYNAVDMNEPRKVKGDGETDFIVTVQFSFEAEGSTITGAGTYSRRHIDVCVMDP